MVLCLCLVLALLMDDLGSMPVPEGGMPVTPGFSAVVALAALGGELRVLRGWRDVMQSLCYGRMCGVEFVWSCVRRACCLGGHLVIRWCSHACIWRRRHNEETPL